MSIAMCVFLYIIMGLGLISVIDVLGGWNDSKGEVFLVVAIAIFWWIALIAFAVMWAFFRIKSLTDNN